MLSRRRARLNSSQPSPEEQSCRRFVPDGLDRRGHIADYPSSQCRNGGGSSQGKLTKRTVRRVGLGKSNFATSMSIATADALSSRARGGENRIRTGANDHDLIWGVSPPTFDHEIRNVGIYNTIGLAFYEITEFGELSFDVRRCGAKCSWCF